MLQSFYQVAVLLVLNFAGLSILGLNHENHAHAVEVKNTMIFNAFVMCQVRESSLLSSLVLKTYALVFNLPSLPDIQ